MKKLFLIIAIFAISTLSAITASAIEGDGTAETPFLITNQGELELITDFPDCHFKLENDIALEGTWIPLCKHTSSGRFTGMFDGAGYTISNLSTDGSEGGLFKDNGGTIKNVKIIISEEGTKGTGVISDYNYGTISNCSVNGSLSDSDAYMGGICAYNEKTIEQCKFEGNIKNNDSSGGYYTTGGICGKNSSVVKDCYFIGQISGSYYKYGIGEYNNGSITNCYAVPSIGSNNHSYGISNSISNIKHCYYDKTVSGLTSTYCGTPKSTAAMKMKQTYSANWDFENVWGIDKNINNGYPYLLWEYPDVEEESPYTVNSVKLVDLSGNELEAIPEDSFYFEVNVTKNDNSKDADSLIIAVYDENGAFIDVKYMNGTYYQNQTMTFGTMINKTEKKIANIKGFVWDSISGMTPLSNSLELTN